MARAGRLAAGHELCRVLAHYRVGSPYRWHRVERGYVNETWAVDTLQGSYVLRRRHPRLCDREAIAAQHALIAHLRSAGFPAPTIVPTRAGGTFLELDGEVYELQARVPGQVRDQLEPSHRAAAARTLAHYHLSVAGFDAPALHRPRERYLPSSLVSIFASCVAGWEGGLPSGAIDLVARLRWHVRDLSVRLCGLEGLASLVVHGDYYTENLIFDGQRIVGVVDYDEAHWAWRAIEVAEALIYFARLRPRRLRHIVYENVLDLDCVSQFLAAYQREASLEEDEREALPHLVRLIWVCAALDPPLCPRMAAKDVPRALPELLMLADWAVTHTGDLIAAGAT